jgi:hypothetical protein
MVMIMAYHLAIPILQVYVMFREHLRPWWCCGGDCTCRNRDFRRFRVNHHQGRNAMCLLVEAVSAGVALALATVDRAIFNGFG